MSLMQVASACSRLGPRARRIAAACGFAAIALAGCGSDPGSFMVDPGKYSVMHCNDLVAQMKALQAREKELRNLQDKASAGGVGTVIGNIAYRPDFESVLTQERQVQREAAGQKCELAPGFQSDQTIR